MTDMVPMYGFGGGRGGGNIRVYVDPGSQVTLTQTHGGKTKTAVADSSGQALFKGLDGGQWEAVATLNGQTAKGSTIVSLDYDLHLTFFTATINITYPAGLTCKATDGVTTLTAPDTSGTWACEVPNAGAWTVKLSSGFTEKITVAASGEIHTVDKWYVYKDGDQRTGLTGGWKTVTKGSATVTLGDSDASVSIPGLTGQPGGLFTTEIACNFTGFRTLNAAVNVTSAPNTSLSKVEVGVSNTQPSSAAAGKGIVFGSNNKAEKQVLSADLSSTSESLNSVYPYFLAYCASAAFSSVWLEV